MQTYIEIEGARENNLKNLHVSLPHHSMIVITGVSGSGKSSLAYDTLFKEGQRRFLESLSAYARQFLGEMSKPNVERIQGLAPSICIDQKRHGTSSRSTVGTITEIYDYLRLLFSRLGTAYCPDCNVPVLNQNSDQITQLIISKYIGKMAYILAPMVVGRKGEYRKELSEWLSDGFVRIRIDGQIYRLDEPIQLERYVKHTLQLVIDRIDVSTEMRTRITQGIENAITLSEGQVAILLEDTEDEESPNFFKTPLNESKQKKSTKSKHIIEEVFSVKCACPKCGYSLPELEPRLFSFNNEQGYCRECRGQGFLEQFDPNLVVPNPELSIRDGAIAAMKKDGKIIFSDFGLEEIEKLAKNKKVDLSKPWKDLPEYFRNQVLWGEEKYKIPQILNEPEDETEEFEITQAESSTKEKQPTKNVTSTRDFLGVIPELERMYFRWHLPQHRRFLKILECRSCGGTRLRRESRHVLFQDHNICQLSKMTIQDLMKFLDTLELENREKVIGDEIFKEIKKRLQFLINVGLPYLTVDRHANTLAGGELQRIRLARQLGAGLQGVLYVLDEPSIGLHARDNIRLIHTLTQLRDVGNTVVVIEHDEETMRTADQIIDIGPEAGIHGGKLVAQGKASDIMQQKDSITGKYLSHIEMIESPKNHRIPQKNFLTIYGAKEHNLKKIDVKIPLGVFVAVTGVSGSGKSSLVDDILYKAVSRELHQNSEIPGQYDRIEGIEFLDKIIEVDQSPIGRTPRSNPVTYIKLWDEIRELFTKLTESKARGYEPGRFSFNVKGGRCEHCEGAGCQEIEMEFLANVLIPCEECGGTRFNRETLEITYKGKNISEILDMTVLEACTFFANHPKILKPLKLLCDVGMDYIKLGQPSPTLSGGEAQRIKLVRELCRNGIGKTLYIFDEPTTGLHFADIKKLLYALNRLVEQGNTVLVIEHNLDVIKVADWIIDLGPEGGDCGGNVVITGTPETVMKCENSYTGKALKDYLNQQWTEYHPAKEYAESQEIIISGAHKHNLKNIKVIIPKNKLTLVTGVSGSGKSSLVFDTLFAEGQRRFLESLSTYARRFLGRLDHGEVDSIVGLSPSIAIDQKSVAKNPRSTVATMTEIYDYLRVLYARIGTIFCPHCHKEILSYTPTSAAQKIVESSAEKEGMLLAPLYMPGTHKIFTLETPAKLRDYAVELLSEGFNRILIGGKPYKLDELPKDLGKRVPIHLVIDRITPTTSNISRIAESLEVAFRWGHKVAIFYVPGKMPMYFSELLACIPCEYYRTEELHPRHFSFNHNWGYCPQCKGLGIDEKTNDLCSECQGARLKPEYLAVKIAGLSIYELCQLRIDQSLNFFNKIKLNKNQNAIAKEPIREIINRLNFLKDVGLEYLTLERRSNTLAGGEAQRIRLATQIGNQLVGVLYVLDEPTIGLHQRDTQKLLGTLRKLVDLGNTIVMVEHDIECIKSADHIIELGPGPGDKGGNIVTQGSVTQIQKVENSPTGQYLAGKIQILKEFSLPSSQNFLTIHKANLHNLKNITVAFPTQRFSVVSGVSGSGKSSLVVDILQKNLQEFNRIRTKVKKGQKQEMEGSYGSGFEKITGLENFERFIVIDQSQIMRTPASNPATYCDIFTSIRELFANLPGSRSRGFDVSRFSFNRPGGRCEVCEGRGLIEVEMHFLSDVWVTCHACQGKRYLEETLAVHYKDKNIAQILEMDISQALKLFDNQPRIKKKLQILENIGLGYMHLGQPINTFSGGEAQRLKLAAELCQPELGRTLYIMDEPTTGLHALDIVKLLDVIHQLIQQGHSVIVIEHNLDVIRAADWIVDLGPEAGESGGELLYCGASSEFSKCTKSITANIMRKEKRIANL